MTAFLLGLALLPRPAIRLSAKSFDSISLEDLRGRAFVAIPFARADSPRVAKIKALGVPIRIVFMANYVEPEFAKELPLAAFEQREPEAFAPIRTGYLALDNPTAYSFVEERAIWIARRAGDFAGLIVSARTPEGHLYRYSTASRRVAVEATGLDPLDFEEPVPDGSPEAAASAPAFRLPDAVADALLESSVKRTLAILSIAAAPYSAAGKPVGVDANLVGWTTSPRERLRAYAPTPDLIAGLPATEIWLPILDAATASARIGALKAELSARRIRLPIVTFGIASAAIEAR